jgi:hypothetical protein
MASGRGLSSSSLIMDVAEFTGEQQDASAVANWGQRLRTCD